MNSETLNTIFTINSLPTGLIQAVYTFESGSGCLIFNDYYPTGEQVYNGDVTRPVLETCPAVSISCSANVVNNLNTSSGVISGTETGTTSDTTFSFTIRATDAQGQTADRAFSITINLGANNSGQFN